MTIDCQRFWNLSMLLLLAGTFVGAAEPPPPVPPAPAESEVVIPPVIAQWKDPAYTLRYFIKVDAPGEAGSAGMQVEPAAACLLLPLKQLAKEGPSKVEPVLLMGEDGNVHPVRLRPVGSEVEVTFGTRSGLRRFYLYSGAAEGKAARASERGFQPPDLVVKMRGRSAPPDFIYNATQPLTLERFKALGESERGVVDARLKVALNDAECPLFSILTDNFGHVTKIDNPQRYTSVYEGFLRTPVTGAYKLAIDTPGVAHLLLDGKEVLGTDAPDPKREPFFLNKTIDLAEGIHRVVLYYAEAMTEPDRTNMDMQRFGFRLHWQPPYAKSLLCVPPQAFPIALPSRAIRCEGADSKPQPFIEVENLAQVHASSHMGENGQQKLVLLLARTGGGVKGSRVCISVPGQPDAVSSAENAFVAAWIPAGSEVKTSVIGPDNAVLASRPVTIPMTRIHAKDAIEKQERFEMEGELVVKSAPDFIYPDETAHIHLEAMLSPAPVIMYKERIESKLVSPPPRPMGQYTLNWWVANDSDKNGGAAAELPPELSGTMDATPVDGTRKKLRISIPVSSFAALAKTGDSKLIIRLSVGDAMVESASFRLLNAHHVPWPGSLIAGAGNLLFKSSKTPVPAAVATATDPAAAAAPSIDKENDESHDLGSIPAVEEELPRDLERVMVMIEHEDETAYRSMFLLKKIGRGSLGSDALFLGDPLVEIGKQAPVAVPEKDAPAPPPSNALAGVAKALARDMPQYTWKGVQVAGPHRHLPIFRMIAGLDAFMQKQPGTPIPGLVVLSLGQGDLARQTPLHTFERALSMLVERLRAAGAKKILVLGIVPEPGRDRQSEPYQERMQDTLRQHHIDYIDLLQAWKDGGGDWMQHYSLDGSGGKLYGPLPNTQSLDEIVKLIEGRL